MVLGKRNKADTTDRCRRRSRSLNPHWLEYNNYEAIVIQHRGNAVQLWESASCLAVLMFRSVPITNAATNAPWRRPLRDVHFDAEAVAGTSNRYASTQRAEPAKYVGVIFTRQSADIVARSEGTLEAVHVNLGDHVKRRRHHCQNGLLLRLATIASGRCHIASRSSGTTRFGTGIEGRRNSISSAAGTGGIGSDLQRRSGDGEKFSGIEPKPNGQAAQARVAEQAARSKTRKQSLAEHGDHGAV